MSVASSADAAWTPFAVSQAPGIQQSPVATSDGAGGAFTVWMDDRSGSQALYVHHVLAAGGVDPAWPANGLLVGPGSYDYRIVSDGGSGAIIVAATSQTDIKAYHVLATGALDPVWPSGGVTVLSGAGNAYWLQLVRSGTGNAIAIWSDERNSGTNGIDIYAQRILSTGVVDPAWPVNGAAVCALTSNQVLDAAVSDGSDGVIVGWEDNRGGNSDVYAQRVISNGTIHVSWPADGKALCNADGDQLTILACSDGAGGAIMAWNDRRENNYDIYAMRVQANSHLGTGWAQDGELIADDGDYVYISDMVADGSGGAVMSWGNSASSNVHVQKVTASGTAAWTPNGVDVSLAPVDQSSPVIAMDGSGGVYLAWQDGRFYPAPHYLYVHHVLSSGSVDPAWPEDGGRVSYGGLPYWGTALVANGSGGATVIWSDGTQGSDDLFAIGLTSTWAAPLPVAVSAAPPIAGSVTRSPDLPAYGAGSSVTLTAVPESGHTFILWSGDASGSTNPLTLTVNSAKNVVAVFDGYEVNVTISPAGGGSVGRNPDQPHYSPGSQVTLTATPATGYAFSSWSGDASGNTNPLTVTVDAPKSITANFLGYPVDVTVSPSGSGTVAKNPNQATYPPGAQVTLTATGTNGYAFTSWSGDASGSTNPLIVTVNAPKSITANFSVPPPGCGDWNPITSVSNPVARVGAPMVWDPVRHRVLMFGGHDGSNYLNDVWQFTFVAGWSQITTSGTPPSPRDAAGLIYDPVRDRLLVVCGNNVPAPNDVFQLTLDATPTWSPISPTGTAPTGRFAFSAIYDPPRDRVVLFGGYPLTNTVWSLSLAGTPDWTQLAPTGTPPAVRYGHVGIYDPVRDRMLVQGGNGSVVFSDTWAMSLAGTPAWTQLAPGGTPPQVYMGAGIYDPVRDRMLVVSGYGPSGPGTVGNVRSLSLEIQPMWSLIPAGGVSLAGRYFHSAVYEPELDFVLNSQGIGTSGYLGDTKRLLCAGGWWLQTGATNANGSVTATPSKACYGNGEMVNLNAVGQGGYGLYQWLGDASGGSPSIDVTMNENKTILAQFGSGGPVGVEETLTGFALGAIHPNPSVGRLRIECSLAHEAAVSLRVFDVAGREVATLMEGVQAAGLHTVTWDGKRAGSPARSGVYLIRFETPAGIWARRVALIR